MRLYRIYTENINHSETIKLVKSYFPKGFTAIMGTGFYEGGKEHTLIIDVITNSEQHVYDLAWDICRDNAQKSVLVLAIMGEIKSVH